MASFDEQIRQAIPAEFHMISGSHDSQTSADVSNVGQFKLPDPAGTTWFRLSRDKIVSGAHSHHPLF